MTLSVQIDLACERRRGRPPFCIASPHVRSLVIFDCTSVPVQAGESVLSALGGCKLLREISQLESETQSKVAVKELAQTFEDLAHGEIPAAFSRRARHRLRSFHIVGILFRCVWRVLPEQRETLVQPPDTKVSEVARNHVSADGHCGRRSPFLQPRWRSGSFLPRRSRSATRTLNERQPVYLGHDQG